MRFTIRDVLWLTVVVAFATGWFASYRKLQTRIRDWDVQTHRLAAELAIATNENVPISKSSGEVIVTPVCARVSFGLPYSPPSKPLPLHNHAD